MGECWRVLGGMCSAPSRLLLHSLDEPGTAASARLRRAALPRRSTPAAALARGGASKP